MILDDATRRQIAASDPAVSTWLAANAGSGKTRVLTDRVARLLLENVSPQNILCLTYTKAAASEMQNRLFKRLGAWSMMGDQCLADELKKLGAPVDQGKHSMDFARTLFARAIDTPGGLRIQTIHSFCASLLRRFPLEAGVSPMFREMDERASNLLRQEIIEMMAGGDQCDLISELAKHYTGEDFTNLASEAIRNRKLAINPISNDEIWQLFGLGQEVDQHKILADTFFGIDAGLFAVLQTALQNSGKPTDQKAAANLAQVDFFDPGISDLTKLFPILLYGAKVTRNAAFGAKVDAFPTKGVRESHPEIIAPLNNFMERIERARVQYASLLAAEKTRAFMGFSKGFLAAYENRKSDYGWLDFDDLITKAHQLLSDPAVAQWVLFRLDGGLDHILVDEAQDTSPDQWKVIELLAQEFSAGQGARPDVQRTIFVVGDLKQSIYSFQGADPQAFEQMREKFSDDLAASQQQLFDQTLEHSFRSSPAILSLVDAVFQHSDGSGFGGPAKHFAFHKDMPGRVDLWDIVEKLDTPPEKDWFDPSDKTASNDHRVLLAESIAEHIKSFVSSGSIPDGNCGFRQIEYGDFLILVQRRSELFHQIIRACKSLGLPIAGADRLKIGAEMAVKDLQALMAFLALPQDSLSLAAALRSPLFGLGEADLFDLANSRSEIDLWSALIRRQSDYQQQFDILTDLRAHVDFSRPYELLERILTRHNGRNNLLARLGPEAEDGIDALLNQAVTYEAMHTPSLTGFLIWLAAEGVEIKRQSDNVGGRIRVMTTHGAKGLESPIVILPDTGDRRPPQQDEIIKADDGSLIWKTSADLRPPIIAAALDRAKMAHDKEAARLLYVALTRAEKWLIVCASGNVKEKGHSWYRQVEAGMNAIGAERVDGLTGPILRVEHGQWHKADKFNNSPQISSNPEIPDWATANAVNPKSQIPPLSPSNIQGDKSLPGEYLDGTTANAALHGSHIHKLLEHLPNYQQVDWPKIANQLLPGLADENLSGLISEATRVINNPLLSHLFDPEALAEVELTATLPGPEGRRIRGTIDRLVITKTKVVIVDFKSNRLVPGTAAEVPIGILRQMAAYLVAIEKIYPDREISLAIVWTHTSTLMPLPHDIVRASLQ